MALLMFALTLSTLLTLIAVMMSSRDDDGFFGT